jgi:hypothetical protein
MDPLSAIEEIIGDVDTWPTYIIHDLFITEPTVKSVKTVVAFMCGNGIPCELAIDCFNACNGLKKSGVAAYINQYYAEWDSLPYRTYATNYCSVFFKRWQWMNGEPVHLLQAMSPVRQFGIENTGCPLLIGTTINRVRSRTYN